MGERRGINRVLVGKPERNRPLGRSRHRWEDNINTDLQEVGCGGMEWIELAQDSKVDGHL
jgi:3-oxoacyl-ACP reductase-like protein